MKPVIKLLFPLSPERRRMLAVPLLLLPAVCLGQHATASLQAIKAQYEPKSRRLALTCQLINGDSTQTFYKPTTWDYCAQLSFLQIRDATTKKESSYLPCTSVLDLEQVPLTAANTVRLQPGASYTFTQYLHVSHIRPLLVKGRTYLLSFAFNHEYLCGGMKCQAFTGMLRSTPIEVIIP
jgi:hypothetical protein